MVLPLIGKTEKSFELQIGKLLARTEEAEKHQFLITSCFLIASLVLNSVSLKAIFTDFTLTVQHHICF